MSLSRECDMCHCIDHNPLFNQSMHLARDGLHVNRNGAYVLVTALKSFVVDMDMEQITSAEKLNSLDMWCLVDTYMTCRCRMERKLSQLIIKTRLEEHEVLVNVSEAVTVILPLSAIYNIYKDFDLVVLDEVMLLVTQRYMQDVLAAKEENDYNLGERQSAIRLLIVWS